MGGGVLRTVAKVASTGYFRSPFVGEASRRAARQAPSSFVPAVEPGLNVPSLYAGATLTESPAVAVAARLPDWEFDEWELAGDKEQSLNSVDVSPRLVFGSAPTIEEAEEATTDLKDALEKVYFTPDHTLGSHGGGQATSYGESGAVSAVPKHVTQMFSLLNGSSEAQTVVASLAADKNVWEAVMKNEKVLEFCKNSPSHAETQKCGNIASEFSATTEERKTGEGSFVSDLLGKIKVRVSQVVSDISEYLQDIFGISSPPSAQKETSSGADDKSTNMTLGASFMALAVAAILIIVFKRA